MAEEEAPATVTPAPAPVAAAAAPLVSENTPAPDTAPVVIIGSGYAGYGAAEGIRKRSPQTPIVLFTSDDGADYTKPGLSNALARGLTPDAMVKATAADKAKKLDITVHATTQVTNIDTAARQVSSDKGIQPYSKLILATGAEPVRLPLAGDGADDVVSVNSLMDYRILRDQLAGAKRICIIGNGLVGCEYANELINQGFGVSLVGLTSWPLDTLMPESIGRDLQSKLAALGVNWYLENTVQTINKQANAYQVTLTGGQQIEADLVLSCVGLKPRTELAAAAGIHCNRGIVVDEYLQTSAPDVYALGDCSEIQGQVLPYIAPITHGLRALSETIVGNVTAVSYPLMPVVVKTPALPLLLLPPQPGQQGEWKLENSADGSCGLLVDAAGNAVGFALSGAMVNSQRQRCLDAVSAG
ncbi:MAG: FAD-dependent oxidoreductase [Thiolinea sp.]